MNKIRLTIALACSLFPMGAAALQKAEDFEQAKALVQDDGYMVFAYADGWDTFSKKACRNMLADKAVQKAIGNAAVLEFAVPNVSSKEDKEAVKKRFGALALPNPSQYPAIYMYDKSGRLYSTICIAFKDLKKYKSIASQIGARRDLARKQQELLDKAAKAQGVEKARLIGQASELPDIVPPAKALDQIKKADPKDESGYVRRMGYNPWGVAEASAKNKDWKAALADVEKRIADPAYTDDQRQKLYATAIGLLYSHPSGDNLKKMRRYGLKMQELDPDSVLGQSFTAMAREWITSLSLSDGWSPSTLPADKEPAEVEGPLPIREPGVYNVTFKWKSGSKGLTVLAVELYDGKAKVAEDRHKGFAGIKENKPNYSLKVAAPVKEPRLFITVDMVSSRDSSGMISVSRAR